WVICSGQVIEWDVQGNPLRMIGCHVNITQRKQAEEQMQKSDMHLKTAQRIAKLGSWEFDIAAEQIIWSEEMFHIFGRDPALGTPATFDELQTIFHPDDRALHAETVQTTIATGQPYDKEFRVYHADGTLAYLHVKGSAMVDSTGNITHLLGTALDISDRKQAEQKIQQTVTQLTATNQEILDWL
ncbi:MAG: PAS domain-containing protein, partial [Cyanobacteria bacterium J06638_22]